MRTSNLKPLIAILSLPVFSFIAGQYLPYVITAISGSGVIAAVPLAIFAISAVVALISVAYLAKLVVSTINDKKKIDLNTVGCGISVQTNNVSTQAEVTSGNDVSTQTTAITSTTPPAQGQNMLPIPTSPPVTLGTQPNPSASIPPPPPPPMTTSKQLNKDTNCMVPEYGGKD